MLPTLSFDSLKARAQATVHKTRIDFGTVDYYVCVPVTVPGEANAQILAVTGRPREVFVDFPSRAATDRRHLKNRQ